MRYEQDPDRTRLDPYPAAEPPAGQVRPVQPPSAQPQPARQVPPQYAETAREDEVVEEGVTNPDHRRIRTVNVTCTVINLICAVFAIVLGLHIILVLGSANPANGFASFVDSWARNVSLGLRDLFTPDEPKLRVLFNEGLAAIVWLAIGATLTYLIRRFAMPDPGRSVRYHRRVVR